jgi:hypothetical protein
MQVRSKPARSRVVSGSASLPMMEVRVKAMLVIGRERAWEGRGQIRGGTWEREREGPVT